jgi:hypothetical protein
LPGRISFTDPVHGQHDVEAPHLQRLERLLDRRGVREARRAGQIEVFVFEEDLLGEVPFLLHDERVVQRRDQQHLAHAMRHEVVELVELARRGFGHQVSTSGRVSGPPFRRT